MADNGVDDWCLFHISVVAFIKFVWTVRIFRVAPPVILDMFMFGFHICCRAFDSGASVATVDRTPMRGWKALPTEQPRWF